jgi:peroxiredoxin
MKTTHRLASLLTFPAHRGIPFALSTALAVIGVAGGVTSSTRAADKSEPIEILLEDQSGALPIMQIPANIPVPLQPQPAEPSTQTAEDLGEGALYGVLRNASPDGALGILVFRAADGSERVVLDLNDNEDFSDDAVKEWEGDYGVSTGGYRQLPTLRVTTEVACTDAGAVPVELILGRYDQAAAPERAAIGISNGIVVSIDSYRLGTGNFDGRELRVALIPTSLAGEGPFTYPGAALVIDVDNDGELNGHPFKSRERFRLGSHFVIGDRGYKVSEKSCDGRRLVLSRMDAARAARAPQPGGGPAPGDDAPEFELATIEGDTIRLSDYRGKVVLLDFWATWCYPCRIELPYVRRAYERFHDHGFEIIGISFDRGATEVRSYTKMSQMPWPQILQGRGVMTPLKRDYGVRSIPAAFLIDRDGRIAGARLRGEGLINAIESLISKESERSD